MPKIQHFDWGTGSAPIATLEVDHDKNEILFVLFSPSAELAAAVRQKMAELLQGKMYPNVEVPSGEERLLKVRERFISGGFFTS